MITYTVEHDNEDKVTQLVVRTSDFQLYIRNDSVKVFPMDGQRLLNIRCGTNFTGAEIVMEPKEPKS